MKKRYIIVLLFFLLIIGLTVLKLKKCKAAEIIEVRKTYSSQEVSESVHIKELKYEDEKTKISVYYPVTLYSNLNSDVLNKIEKISENFKSETENINDVQKIFSLSINFDSYEYEDYISYAFFVTEDVLGAHPSYKIFTINYDIKNGSIITIDDIVNSNKMILNKLSNICFETLSKDEKIAECGNTDMLVYGTMPKKENFENFVFTNLGLKILFEKYSVAPYVLGEFYVCIPYEKLK